MVLTRYFMLFCRCQLHRIWPRFQTSGGKLTHTLTPRNLCPVWMLLNTVLISDWFLCRWLTCQNTIQGRWAEPWGLERGVRYSRLSPAYWVSLILSIKLFCSQLCKDVYGITFFFFFCRLPSPRKTVWRCWLCRWKTQTPVWSEFSNFFLAFTRFPVVASWVDALLIDLICVKQAHKKCQVTCGTAIVWPLFCFKLLIRTLRQDGKKARYVEVFCFYLNAFLLFIVIVMFNFCICR